MNEKNVTLILSPSEVSKVLDGLNELPHKQVADLFLKIKVDAIKQLQEKKPEDNAPST